MAGHRGLDQQLLPSSRSNNRSSRAARSGFDHIGNQPHDSESLKELQARQARRKAEFDQAAQELSRMILGPVAEALGKKRLLIVGDGIMQYIPFGVLPEPEIGGTGDDGATGRLTRGAIARQRRRGDREKWKTTPRRPRVSRPAAFIPLIVNHEIVMLPGFSAGDAATRIRTGRSTAPHALAILADPVFSDDDRRVALNARTKIESIQGPDQSVREAPVGADGENRRRC